MKHGIAISTYINKNEARLQCRLKVTIDSLNKSGYNGNVIIVDDGSPVYRDLGFLQDLESFHLYLKPGNSGISRCKNTSIRLLMHEGVDVGWLADDDLYFEKDWWKPYLEIFEKTDIQHTVWGHKEVSEHEIIEYQGVKVKKLSWMSGALLGFTPKVIEKVGGFPIIPGITWGWDHCNWTNRILAAELAPFIVDAQNSENLVKLSEFSEYSAVSKEIRRKCREIREQKVGKIYRPLIE